TESRATSGGIGASVVSLPPTRAKRRIEPPSGITPSWISGPPRGFHTASVVCVIPPPKIVTGMRGTRCTVDAVIGGVTITGGGGGVTTTPPPPSSVEYVMPGFCVTPSVYGPVVPELE